MKKAKIILSAVALLAVVGGALAFKSSRIPQAIFYTNTTLPNGRVLCTVPTALNYTLVGNPANSTFVTGIYTRTSTVTTIPCPGFTVYPTN